MSWLVTGGAGYIGGHIVSAMRAAGERVVVLDDLSSGDPARNPDVEAVVGSVLDGPLVEQTLRDYDVRGIVHVAAKKQVEESVLRPLRYYRENVEGLRVVLEAASATGVEAFLFSSSAAVYGAPDVPWVDEDTPCAPVNPYGSTKLVGEWLLREVAAATGLRYAALRYFNVAGTRRPELADRGVTNLVPMVLQRLAERRAPLVFGADYDTADGTCVRDFIHVADVASAHVAAAAALLRGELTAVTANIGRGQGVSVREVINSARRVTGTAGEPWAEPELLPRRAGDPPRVVASADRIAELLGWRATFGLDDMISSAWAAWGASTDGTAR